MFKYRKFAEIGCIIWCGTIILRLTPIMSINIIKQVLWRTPNFGAAWIVTALAIYYYKRFLKKDFNEKYIIALMAIILLLFIFHEILQIWLHKTNFDIWDIFASFIALMIFYLWIFFKKAVR